jgi:putative transposase
MDDAHFVAAIRYVELNPVRARLVERPEDWRWSSARGRVNGRGDPLVRSRRPDLLSHIDDWRAFLAECLSDEDAERIRQGERRGGVIGGPAFIARVERVLGRDPQPKPRGRPRRKIGTGRISLETSTTFDPA